MGHAHVRKPLLRYRFKDSMGCVFFREFQTDREARLWHERNKVIYSIREFGNVGLSYSNGLNGRLNGRQIAQVSYSE